MNPFNITLPRLFRKRVQSTEQGHTHHSNGETKLNAETTKSLKPKHYTVTKPNGEKLPVLAATQAGAIRDAKAADKKEEAWSAELSTGEELLDFGRRGVRVLNAPEPVVDDGQDPLPL
jgi:hypothetical protein